MSDYYCDICEDMHRFNCPKLIQLDRERAKREKK